MRFVTPRADAVQQPADAADSQSTADVGRAAGLRLRHLPSNRPTMATTPSPLCSAVLATLLGMAAPAHAASVAVAVTDAAGKALADAVVMLEPVNGRQPARPMPTAEISQSQRRFMPRVTVVTVGTGITFPNFDTVRHHVYSFSAAKQFELKLYAGVPNAPVVFDKPGIAVLGCNIHDQMAAWVVVVDTPHHAKTDASGQVTLTGVPAGAYRMRTWHPGLPDGTEPAPSAVTVGSADLSSTVRLAAVTTP